MTDEQLLRGARELDSQALGAIHDLYYPQIYRYIRYRLNDEQLCEDISADVFLQLLDALHRGKGPQRNLRGWLFGTASNLVNNHLRQRYRRQEEPLNGQVDHLPADCQPEDIFADNWRQEQVRLALADLTEDQQHVLALRFSYEHSIEETAQIMDKSISAVKALQFRAVNALKRLLERQRVSP